MSSKLALILVLVLAISAPVVADVAVEREVTVSSQDADEYRPSIAYNGARDEYLVVWSDSWQFVVNPAPFRTIMARRVDRYGKAIGSAFQLTPDDFHDRQHPDVVYDPMADAYLVVYSYNWEEGSSSVPPTDWDIRGIRLGSDGTPTSTEFTISSAVDDELEPKVAVSWPLGEAPKYMVVWTNQESTGMSWVRGALFPWGTPPSPFTVANVEFSYRMQPDVAYSYFYNNFLVAYMGTDTVVTGDIYVTAVAHDGTVGSPITVAGWPDAETNPAIASCYWKNFIITWESELSATDTDIYARRVRGDGLILDAPTHVSAWALLERNSAVGCFLVPDGIDVDQNDEYLIAFELQYSNETGPFGITAATINDSGVVLEPVLTVRAPYIGEDGVTFHPAVAGGAAGWFVGWEHTRLSDPSYLDMHARAVWDLFADGFEFGDCASWSSVTP
jgi:hypothetical protein